MICQSVANTINRVTKPPVKDLNHFTFARPGLPAERHHGTQPRPVNSGGTCDRVTIQAYDKPNIY